MSIAIGTEKQLFVDDYVIEKLSGVRKVLNPAQKHPSNPLIFSREPWEEFGLNGHRTAVLYDPDDHLYKMWPGVFHRELASGGSYRSYVTSEDGLKWERPRLGLLEFAGSRENNLVSLVDSTVLYTPDDFDPARRYKGLAFGGATQDDRWELGGNYGAIFSPDGIRWTPYEHNPVIINAHEVNQSLFIDPKTGRYYCFPKQRAKSGKWLRRSVAMTWSEDFVNWAPTWVVLVADGQDDKLACERIPPLAHTLSYNLGEAWYHAQFYAITVFPYESLYLGLLDVLYVSGGPPGHVPVWKTPVDGPVVVELASSRDLLNWGRAADRAMLVCPGPRGSWDQSCIYSVNPPLVVDDEIRIYYGGWPLGHMFGADRVPEEGAPGIGLATLRLDGFVSVDAGRAGGTLTTKPLTFSGKQLMLNVDSRGGLVAVELLEANGRPIAGFSSGDCDSFCGDSLRQTVTWRGSSDVSHLAGRPVRLRFHLQSCKLYAFAFVD